MQTPHLLPGDRNHLTGGIQLHGTGAQGYHAVGEREVFVLQVLQEAKHLGLRRGKGEVEGKLVM